MLTRRRCCCSAPSCASPTISGRLTGCGSVPYPGVTIEAHDATAGGTLLGTATTDGSGNYTLSSLTGSISGNVIVLVALVDATRFTSTTKTLTYGGPSSTAWTCGATSTNVNMTATPATGYVCLSCGGCYLPVATTLYLTDSVIGTITLTYSTGTFRWEGTTTYSFPGQDHCPARSCTVNYFISNRLNLPLDFPCGLAIIGYHEYTIWDPHPIPPRAQCCPQTIDDGCLGVDTLRYLQPPDSTTCPTSLALTWHSDYRFHGLGVLYQYNSNVTYTATE
jgi:hypothetical protein